MYFFLSISNIRAPIHLSLMLLIAEAEQLF
jgi:hypothetical protein